MISHENVSKESLRVRKSKIVIVANIVLGSSNELVNYL